MSKIPDIDPDRTWVTSDSHFGHQNIVGFCDRPTDHEEAIVRGWAEEVPADATLIHLGDLSWKNNGYFKNIIAPKLPGSPKYLILGNHDRQRFSFYRDCGFKIIDEFEQTFYVRGYPWMVGFSHYPLKAPKGKNYVHLHGHIHNNGYGGVQHPFAPFAMGQINLSVEQTHYRPVNLGVLLDAYLYGCYEESPIKGDGVNAQTP